MDIREIKNLIENFAPLNTQEDWDNCGFQVEIEKDVQKLMLCLSITQGIINQAVKKNCDIIISHHPLFLVPFEFNKGISIYSAHTNLDKADGGTTDTLIRKIGLKEEIKKCGDFLRFVELEENVSLDDFISLIKSKLEIKNLKIVNNFQKTLINKIAFCAGSGADFFGEAEKIGSDVIVTGDVKYHTALESNVIIIDVGHFESEYPVLKTIEKLLKPLKLEVVTADEKSPFINY